jgi:hypothetical protein
MTVTTFTLQGSPRKRSPWIAEPIGRAAAAAYTHGVALLASWLRPRQESPAEAAARLRSLANQYHHSQPGFAADLRAAADRHNNFGEG